ncbi:DNA polymerase III subunit [Candidatus Falkowbacteria bacterium]|nr:DNA polymerase III subunit [Candidatus Falkowbacteria bacterium]
MAKYRVSDNWGLVGHQQVVDFLSQSSLAGQVAHAYCISGQGHVGKRTLTRRFVARLLCEKPQGGTGGACGQCSNCQQLAGGVHPDLLRISRERDAKTNALKKNISIEQIRALKDRLSRGSFLNHYYIAVIEQAELLSLEAASALLKLLEEPARQVVVVLITNQPDRLPDTIMSRCQQLHLKTVSQAMIYERLIALEATRQQAEELSALSQGRPGVALGYYTDQTAWHRYQERAKEFLDLLFAPPRQRFAVVAELAKHDDDAMSNVAFLSEVLDVWSLLLRDLLLLSSSRQEIPEGLANRWLLKSLKTATLPTPETQVLSQWLDHIAYTKSLCARNVNPQLALESLVLQF